MKSVFHIILISLLFHGIAYSQWSSTGGPAGGAGYLFKDQHLFWCGTGSGGLYLSSDEGLLWTRHPDIPQNATIYNLARKSEWLFASTNVYGEQTGYQNRIYRSGDNGITWQKTGTVPDQMQYNGSMEIAVIKGNLFLFDNSSRMFRSYNDGQSWVTVPLPDAGDYTLYHDNATILAKSYDKGLFMSPNGGISWTLLADTASMPFIDISLIRDTTIIGRPFFSGLHNYVISRDRGFTWDTIPTFGSTILDFRFMEGGGDTLYALDRQNDKQLYMSPDNGQNWEPAGYFDDYINPRLRTGSGGLRTVNYGTIERFSNQDQQWTISENGLNAMGYSELATNDEYLLYWGSNTGLSRKKLDGSGVWEKIFLPYKDLLSSKMAVSGDSIYLTTYKAVYLVVENGIGLMDTLLSALPVEGIERITVNGKYLVISGYHKIVLADRFTKEITLLDSLPGEDGFTKSLEILGERWVYTDGEGNAFISLDQGNTWTQKLVAPNNVFANNNFLYRMKGDMLVYVLDKFLAVSTDKGETWSYVYKGLRAEQASVIPKVQQINSLDDNTWVLTTFWNGVFISKDFGQNWIPFNHGMPPNQLLTSTTYQQKAYVCTLGAGVWERDITLSPVKGHVFFDQNGNGTNEFWEKDMPNILVTTTPTGLVTQTDSSGLYTTYANLTDTVHIIPPTPYSIMNPKLLAVAETAPDSFITAVTFMQGVKDLKIDITTVSPVVPGFDNSLHIKCSNIGTVVLNPKVVLHLPGSIWVTGTTPVTPGVSTDSIVWDLPSLQPLQSQDLVVNFYVSPVLTINDVLSFSAVIYPVAGDENVSDNHAEIREVVLSSYDPNDKSVSPKDYFTPTQFINNESLIYTIRFQNTGNYPASFVRIVDTLASTLHPSTFQFISASHPVRWSFAGKNIIQFYFGNIQLPDSSSNEAASHGFVKFAVRPADNLPEGTLLENKAAIYFDYNTPVITNTATNLFDYESVTKDKAVLPLTIYPNPTFGLIQITRETNTAGLLVLVDHSGKIAMQKQVNNERHTIDLSRFPAGIYQVFIIEPEVVREGQVVKH